MQGRPPRRARRPRAARADVQLAAVDLVRRRGSEILATANRYAATPEDAEDAFQRGLEILLTKAPSTREDDLVPWLKTVVKHEAFTIRRQRERHSPTTHDGQVAERTASAAATPDEAERWERLRQGAEALELLKPQELRALVLRAEGYSYREISAMTGFSATKVNRCLVEGRRAFLRRIDGIEAGAECDRLAPQLDQAARNRDQSDDRRQLRRHLGGCLRCRARLRALRAARVAPPTGGPAAHS